MNRQVTFEVFQGRAYAHLPMEGHPSSVGSVNLDPEYADFEWSAIVVQLKRQAQQSGLTIDVPAIGRFPALSLTPAPRPDWTSWKTIGRGPASITTKHALAPDVPGWAWEQLDGGMVHLVPASEYGCGYRPGALHT